MKNTQQSFAFLLIFLSLIAALLLNANFSRAEKPTITVGSKVFTESYVLAEIISEVLENAGEVKVTRKFGLGGTGILAEALGTGSIDLYPEYTGTISETLLKKPELKTIPAINAALVKMGLLMSGSLGFNNTYALAMSNEFAHQNKIQSISDLKKTSTIRAGFSHEFMNRSDGYEALSRHYGLNLKNIQTLEHSLAYEAIARDEIDLTDAYSTDAKIERFHLTLLEDDRHYFPDYFAVILARRDFAEHFPKSWAELKKLENSLTVDEMQKLNAMSDLDKKSFSEIAYSFLQESHAKLGPKGTTDARVEASTASKIWLYTKQHLALVSISLLASILLGLPLGIFAANYRKLGQVVLIVSGLLQTIPSLALLCFLIPVFGIGTLPSLIALFLYGLLPIVMNTYTSLITIDDRLSESSRALGLTAFQRLRLIELPVASPGILAGIKTSAIINIGTATLAALIGAGGYGTPIVTGLALNDMHTILMGAIPAAVLSLVVYGFFEVLNKMFIPKGL
jgi:osmoprotectant transport system permease protein